MHNLVSRFVDGTVTGRPARRVLVAFSGGLDSTVLLHAAARCLARNEVELLAAHVNHGLNADAGRWERFCRRAARRFGAGFLARRVCVDVRGRSPEEAARAARYAALETLVREDEVLLAAHHRDDQAETVLLQLLRGAGPGGLAGMPACARFGGGYLARPLLDTPRARIERYARTHGLEWLDDPANDDLAYTRNYVRKRLAPVLRERWPAWPDTLSRAARHQAEASELIGQIARERYPRCRGAGETLSASACRALSVAEQKAVLRYWVRRHGLPVPPEGQLLRLIGALLGGGARAGAMVCWRGAEVRHYRGFLYAMKPLKRLTDRGAWDWLRGTELELPEISTTLTWRVLAERAPALRDAPLLSVRLRRGGEKCAYSGGRFHKHLRKVFQESGVPPWQRDRVPLIYLGDELRLVW